MVKKTVLKRSVVACCMAKGRYRRYVCVLLDAKTQFFSMKMTNLWKRRRRPFFQPPAGVLGEMSSVPSWESLQWLLQTCFSPLWDFVEAPSDMHCVYMEAARHPSCSAGRPANGNVLRKLMKAAEWAYVCAARRRRGGRRITAHEFHFTGWHFCYLGECSQINLPLLCWLIRRRRDVNKDADKP